MSDPHTLATRRPAVRTIAKGIILGLTAVGIGGVTVAYATDIQPYTLTRDGIQLAQPFEPNGHLNARTDAGVTFNIHAEAKCITRTDAECAGKRHDVAQYIGATFIPWTVIGIPADACITWVQRSGANYHYGEHGEPAYCLTEEEPCPSDTPTTTPTTPAPTPEPTVPATPTPDPTTSPEPSSSPSPTTEPSSPPSTPTTPATTSPSETPANTDPTTTSAAPTPSTPAAALTTATPTTATTAAELADTGINLTPWWVLTGVAAIAVGAWLLRLVRPSKGGE